MPQALRRRMLAPVMSCPDRRICPAVGFFRPQMTSHRSSWPLPLTPAMPKISPWRMVKEMPLSRGAACFSCRETSRSVSTGSPVQSFWSRAGGTISWPIIRRASCCSLVSARRTSSTTTPLRMTTMRSATSMTSFILWVMKTTLLPLEVKSLINCMRCSDSWGVRTAVGSSMMRTPALI